MVCTKEAIKTIHYSCKIEFFIEILSPTMLPLISYVYVLSFIYIYIIYMSSNLHMNLVHLWARGEVSLIHAKV